MARKPKLGEILVRAGVIQPEQLQSALGEQNRWGRRLGETLISLGLLEEGDLVRALASQLNLPVVRLTGKRVEREILELIPQHLAEKHGCLPLFVKQVDGVRTLHLGMLDPSDVEALDDARFQSGLPIAPILVSPSELREAIARSYGVESRADVALAERDAREVVLERMVDSMPAVSAAPTAKASAERGEALMAALQQDLGAIGSGELLKALTQLLIEKELIGRDELVEKIRALRGSGADH